MEQNKNNTVFVESTTGRNETPCVVFEGGLELETVVSFRTSGENIFERKGNTVYILPQRHGVFREGDIDVVKIHYLPSFEGKKRVGEREELTTKELFESGVKCLKDMRNLILELRKDSIEISNLTNENFYVYAFTNVWFSTFLKQRCGFRGNTFTGDIWIKKNELTSDATLALIDRNIDFFEKYLQRIDNY